MHLVHPARRIGAHQPPDRALAFVATGEMLRLLLRGQWTDRHRPQEQKTHAPILAESYAVWLAVMMLFNPPRTAKSPTTVIARGRHAATRSSRMRFTARS